MYGLLRPLLALLGALETPPGRPVAGSGRSRSCVSYGVGVRRCLRRHTGKVVNERLMGCMGSVF